jgi:hypothetical protein
VDNLSGWVSTDPMAAHFHRQDSSSSDSPAVFVDVDGTIAMRLGRLQGFLVATTTSVILDSTRGVSSDVYVVSFPSH